MKTAFLVSLFILAQAGYHVATASGYAYGGECEGDDVDPIALAQLSIFASISATVSLNVSTVAEVKVKLDIAITASVSVELQVSGSDGDNPGIGYYPDGGILSALQGFYYDVCPATYYRLFYYSYYFWYQGECCWALQNVWLPKCICNFCKLRPYYNDVWFPYLRCVYKYSWQYFPALCWTGKHFRVRYVRFYLPWGCCCESYWPYGLKQQKQCVVAAG